MLKFVNLSKKNTLFSVKLNTKVILRTVSVFIKILPNRNNVINH